MSNRNFGAVLIFMLVVSIALTGCERMRSEAPSVRDGAFIHITSGPENPHAVLMGLQMASIMSADHDVLVYVDLDGVDFALRDGRDITYPGFESSRTQVTALRNKNVPLFVCPGCLKAAGKRPEDLAADFKIADKNAFFNFTNGRILTIDY
jgi:predicted peroxiredoxin